MSVAEDAAQLIALANSFVESAISTGTVASDRISQAEQNISAMKEIVDQATATASRLLGAGHPGMQSIFAAAEAVNTKTIMIQGMLEQVLNEILVLDQAVNSQGNVMGSVGHQLLQSAYPPV